MYINSINNYHTRPYVKLNSLQNIRYISESAPVESQTDSVTFSGASAHVNLQISKKFIDDPTKIDKIINKARMLYENAVYNHIEFGEYHTIDVPKTVEVRAKMKKQENSQGIYKFILTDGSSVLLKKSVSGPFLKCYIISAGKTPKLAQENSEILKSQMELFMTL